MKKQSAATATTILLALILGVSAVVILSNNQSRNPEVSRYTYAVVNSYPHDVAAFTEGLVYENGFLYEGTGLNGYSFLRRVDLLTGQVRHEITLADEFFGEGICVVNDSIVQLTWQSQVGFVYDKNTFDLIRNFTYSTEGWGITFDGIQLIMSDGTDKLHFLDPLSYEKTREIAVHDGDVAVTKINELEYVNGDVYANIWLDQKIAIINPATGAVKGWLDLTGLQGSTVLGPDSVLNGIAYDSQNCRLFVTGKNWPLLFEVKLVT